MVVNGAKSRDGLYLGGFEQLLHRIVYHLHGKTVLISIALSQVPMGFYNAYNFELTAAFTAKDPVHMSMGKPDHANFERSILSSEFHRSQHQYSQSEA
jgi:hypothetical protein